MYNVKNLKNNGALSEKERRFLYFVRPHGARLLMNNGVLYEDAERYFLREVMLW